MLRVQNNRHEFTFDECIKCLSDCFIGIKILFNKMIEDCNSYNNDTNNNTNNDITYSADAQNRNVTILISPKKKHFSPKNIHFRDRFEDNYNLTRPIPIKDIINTKNTITMEIPKVINKMEPDNDNINLAVNNIKLVLDDKSSTDKKTDEIIENNNDDGLDDFELL